MPKDRLATLGQSSMAYAKKTCHECGKISPANHMTKKSIKREFNSKNAFGAREIIGLALGSKTSARRVKTVLFNSGRRQHTGARQVWVCFPCAGLESPEAKLARAAEERLQRIERERTTKFTSTWRECLDVEKSEWKEPKAFKELLTRIQNTASKIESLEAPGKNELLSSVQSRIELFKRRNRTFWSTSLSFANGQFATNRISVTASDFECEGFIQLSSWFHALGVILVGFLGWLVFLLAAGDSSFARFFSFIFIGLITFQIAKSMVRPIPFEEPLKTLANDLDIDFSKLIEVNECFETAVLGNAAQRFLAHPELSAEAARKQIAKIIDPERTPPVDFKTDVGRELDRQTQKQLAKELLKTGEIIGAGKYLMMRELALINGDLSTEEAELIRTQTQINEETRDLAESLASYSGYLKLMLGLLERELPEPVGSKNAIIKSLIQLAATDDKIQPEEERMIRELASELGASKASVTRMLNKEKKSAETRVREDDDAFIDSLLDDL